VAALIGSRINRHGQCCPAPSVGLPDRARCEQPRAPTGAIEHMRFRQPAPFWVRRKPSASLTSALPQEVDVPADVAMIISGGDCLVRFCIAVSMPMCRRVQGVPTGLGPEVLRLQLDRCAVRCSVSCCVPGSLIASDHLWRRYFLCSDHPLKCRKPVQIVGLTCVRISSSLRPTDLARQSGSPLGPRKETLVIKGENHREGLRLPRRSEDRIFAVKRHAGQRRRLGLGRRHLGSR